MEFVNEALTEAFTRTFVLSVLAFIVAMMLTPVYTFVAYRYKFWKRQRTESTTGEALKVFTKLHANKPALIAEATANARKSAEQFAKDSGARISGIRTANQGVVSIDNRDAGSPQVKRVRVVTTVEYFLKD